MGCPCDRRRSPAQKLSQSRPNKPANTTASSRSVYTCAILVGYSRVQCKPLAHANLWLFLKSGFSNTCRPYDAPVACLRFSRLPQQTGNKDIKPT